MTSARRDHDRQRQELDTSLVVLPSYTPGCTIDYLPTHSLPQCCPQRGGRCAYLEHAFAHLQLEARQHRLVLVAA
jgi:hypothetical protein